MVPLNSCFTIAMKNCNIWVSVRSFSLLFAKLNFSVYYWLLSTLNDSITYDTGRTEVLLPKMHPNPYFSEENEGFAIFGSPLFHASVLVCKSSSSVYYCTEALAYLFHLKMIASCIALVEIYCSNMPLNNPYFFFMKIEEMAVYGILLFHVRFHLQVKRFSVYC